MVTFGATDAVMLDGGISAQLLVRRADGPAHSWSGNRAVPLAGVGQSIRKQLFEFFR